MHQLMNALKIRKDIVKLLIGISISFRYSYIAKIKVIELTDQQRLELEDGFRNGKNHVYSMRCRAYSVSGTFHSATVVFSAAIFQLFPMTATPGL